ECSDVRPDGGAVEGERLKAVPPVHLEIFVPKRPLHGSLEEALANDEQVGMARAEARIIDLGASVAAFVVCNLRQLPARADERVRQPRFVEYRQCAGMDRERVAVLMRALVHVDNLRPDAVLLEEQRRDETDRPG